ncbi:class I adenylate-forming enzyme family protein [Pseudogemmobacter humi]|uniref:Benzoate--CoA ligase n=1 Tax=Pseudogemmobacter humi TaxID=2483812 RepID=A0A3P5XB74_9RHOB|nr:class I adenylate-forming enzyme family protein [Pseudogemmobacter humi]VDC31920.1 Benzoate--CoA ligase [Pseudogemmobacter humi]
MAHYDPSRFNLAAHVLAAGSATPDKVALAILTLTGAERWSYARLLRAVLGCGGWLLSRGLTPGDRLLIRLGNSPGYPVLYLGAIAAGIVPVATSPLLTTPEITRMAARIRAKAVVADPGIALPQDCTPWPADLAAWEQAAPCGWHFADADREAYIVFTSGTSATPLAVRHAHRAIMGRAPMHAAWEGLTPSDRLLHSGAFNWTYTMGTGLIDPWTVGATALIAAPSVATEHLGLVLRRHDATIFASVPTVFRRLLRGEMPGLPRLRHALSAGEALPQDLRRAWQEKTGTDIHEAFGMSEISTFLSGSPTRPAPEGTSGFPQPGRRIAVLSDAGEPLPPGEIGRLAVATSDPGLMLSYEGEAPPSGKWFTSGDLVHQDHRGAIHYHGRADEMMNPGGIRISPREVEAALSALPGVSDLAVAEVEPAPGTRIVACFYAGQPVPESTANEFAAARLARYKCPRAWIHTEEIPRGPTGKVIRRRLMALFQEQLSKADR